MCGVLSADEVSAALGVAVTISGSEDSGCDYSADYSTGDFLSLSSRRDTGTLDGAQVRVRRRRGHRVAGQAGIYLPDSLSSLMFIVAPDTGIYTLQMVGSPEAGVDAKAALLSLAALALPRLVGGASGHRAADRPGTLVHRGQGPRGARSRPRSAAQPVTVQSMSGNDLTTSGALPDALLQALTAHGQDGGRCVRRLRHLLRPDRQHAGVIYGLQIDGASMSDLMGVLVPLELNGATPASQTQAQIGGKDVTVIKLADDTPDSELQYMYPEERRPMARPGHRAGIDRDLHRPTLSRVSPDEREDHRGCRRPCGG